MAVMAVVHPFNEEIEDLWVVLRERDVVLLTLLGITGACLFEKKRVSGNQGFGERPGLLLACREAVTCRTKNNFDTRTLKPAIVRDFYART